MVCIRVPVVWLKVNGKAITGHNYWLPAQNPKEVPTQALKLQHQAFSVWAYLPGEEISVAYIGVVIPSHAPLSMRHPQALGLLLDCCVGGEGVIQPCEWGLREPYMA